MLLAISRIATVGIAGACAYNALTVLAAWRFSRRSLPAAKETPPATIILPLKGADAHLEEDLARFCSLDYPDYQIVFAMESEADPAAAVVRRLIERFPRRDLALAAWSGAGRENPKENSHAAALKAAKHGLIVLADGDVLAEPDYLRRALAPLRDPRVGLASCPYRFTGGESLWGELKKLTIHSGFVPQFLLAWWLAPVRFGLGATMAVRREALEKIGGFDAVGAYLASDYHLAEKIAAAGWKVELTPLWLVIRLEPLDAEVFRRWELRWVRTMRYTTPAGYAGLVATQFWPWALLALCAPGGALGVLLLGLALCVRLLCVALVWALSGIPVRGAALGLLPLSDLVGTAFWAAGWLGGTVWWGGRRFSLGAGTTIRTR